MSLQLSNEQLLAATRQFGTPLYVYYAERISQQYQQLTSAFKNVPARFFYAAKALTNINVLKHIKSLGCSIDCSSINEVMLALKAGFSPADILCTSNNIHFSEIETAQQLGVHINIDSLSNLERFANKFGNTYPVGIRLRPNIMAGGNLKISTGHNKSKFGIPVEQVAGIIDLIQRTGLFIRTLHIHTGSEIKDVEVFIKGLDVLFELAPIFPQLEVIDLGGGFKVPYEPGERGTDMELLGVRVGEGINSLSKKISKPLEVWFEPGKFLVSEAGYFITQVNVLKEGNGTSFAGVNSGLNHLIRPMFYGSYHQIENISNPNAAQKLYTVVGNICETDTFAEDRLLPEVREGDYLVFRNAGAYCFEMASNYNSRFKPAEVLVKNDQLHLIRERDILEDLLHKQQLVF
jgi:diaminopimelate decarboxylase